MGLFWAGTWHLSGGEKHDGHQVIYLKLFHQSALYNDFKKSTHKIKYITSRFYDNFLKSLFKIISAYCKDKFFINKLIEMNGENNNVKFTKDLSLDRQLKEVRGYF
jgi:hypothetical protein